MVEAETKMDVLILIFYVLNLKHSGNPVVVVFCVFSVNSLYCSATVENVNDEKISLTSSNFS